LSDDNHYTTAQDLAKITAYALKNPKFREIVSTRTKSIPWKDHDYNRHLVNHNKFLTMYDGCIGVKTGFTKATGRCLVTAVEKDGMCLVCVTLNASDDWNDHKTLYDNAFSEYTPHTVKKSGEQIVSAKIKNGTADTVTLTINQDIIIPVKGDEESSISTKAVPFEDLQAPIKSGDVLGTFVIEIGGQPAGEFPLIAAENVELKNIFFKPTTGNFLTYLNKVFRAWITCFN
jgi:D-alanyl-D-alanine carboxypeptidase (penicillin-binding protein 5/6)